MTGAPIRILGWSEEHGCWAAERDGEPEFASVGDLGDAINASSARGDVPIVITARVYEQMMAQGDA
jgi:hypothetical protein